jgi:hypothetical protein
MISSNLLVPEVLDVSTSAVTAILFETGNDTRNSQSQLFKPLNESDKIS